MLSAHIITQNWFMMKFGRRIVACGQHGEFKASTGTKVHKRSLMLWMFKLGITFIETRARYHEDVEPMAELKMELVACPWDWIHIKKKKRKEGKPEFAKSMAFPRRSRGG